MNFGLLEPDHWQQVWYIMLLQNSAQLEAARPTDVIREQAPLEHAPTQIDQPIVGERLSTVPEEATDVDVDSLFVHEDEELKQELKNALPSCPDLLDDNVEDINLPDAFRRNGDLEAESDPLCWCVDVQDAVMMHGSRNRESGGILCRAVLHTGGT